MIDRYIIQKITPQDLERELQNHPGSKATVSLIETGFKPMNLGNYETEKDATAAKTKWKARDNLEDEIADFVDSVNSKYGSTLSQEEIGEMIREY